MPVAKVYLLLFLLVIAVGRAHAADQSQAVANPEAVALYADAMERLDALRPPHDRKLRMAETPLAVTDVSAAEQLLEKAHALGLPHADYGLACAIYTSGDRSRYPAAFSHAKAASDAGVLEAKALLVGYYFWRIGTPADAARSDDTQEELHYIIHGPRWPVATGAPGTIAPFKTRQELETRIAGILHDGHCTPRTLWGAPRAPETRRLPTPVFKVPPPKMEQPSPGGGNLYRLGPSP